MGWLTVAWQNSVKATADTGDVGTGVTISCCVDPAFIEMDAHTFDQGGTDNGDGWTIDKSIPVCASRRGYLGRGTRTTCRVSVINYGTGICDRGSDLGGFRSARIAGSYQSEFFAITHMISWRLCDITMMCNARYCRQKAFGSVLNMAF